MKRLEILLSVVCCLIGAGTLSSCSMIDEDRSDCAPAPEPEKESEVNYELRLVTNMTTELDTKLSMQTEIGLHHALKKHLEGIFTDFAHDVDLSFYDNKGDSIRLQHDQHIMDASQASYTLYLPKREYMHLAAANLLNDDQVQLTDDEHCHPSKLRQLAADTIKSHTTGLFTARLPMNVLEGIDQDFYVRLYMANCAAVLVVDSRGHATEGMEVFSTGFGTGFNICDSAFIYSERPPIVRTNLVQDEEGGSEIGFCCVNFPSREPSTTRTVIETTEPFVAPSDDESLWEFQVYVPQPETASTRGFRRFTRTVLHVRRPLRAGQLMIIKGWMDDDGGIRTASQYVGVDVTLDWSPGWHFDPEF